MRNERMKKWISMVLCLCMLVQNAPVMAFAATTDNLCDHHAEHTADCGYVEASAGSACTHEHSEDCYAIVSCLHECGDACAEGCVHECTVENGCIVMEKDCHHTHGDCGYAEAVAPQECTTCQSVLVHAENCGYVAPVAEVTCACVPGEDGTVTHTEGCGYVAAVEEETCACEPTVTHGGEGCTYAEGKAGSPCTHVCAVVVDSADSCYQLLCSHRDGGHDDACGYVAAVEGHKCHYECAECAIAPANEEPGDETPVCTCTVKCGETVDTTCAVCYAEGADLSAVCNGAEEPPVVATNNIDAAAMTPEELKAAVDAALAAGYTAITVNLAEDAGAAMFSAITAALATTVDPSLDHYELVMNYSGTIDLTISGAKTVPECTFYVDEYVNENWRAGAALRSVTLTDATTIGESAFFSCAMTSFSAPNVIEIEGLALEGCMKLTDVYLPSVQTLGDAVFSDCYALTTISLPECIDLGNGVFNSCEALETVYAPKATNLGAIEFMMCTSLMKVTLGSVVSVNQLYESIDNGLFCLANDTKNIELILACDQKALSFDSSTKYWNATDEAFAGGKDFIGYTFKSITLAHTPVADDGDCTTPVKCTTCGETVVEAKESHITEKDENKATCKHGDICDLCGTEYGEPTGDHSFDETGKCVCSAQAQTVITVGGETEYYLTLDDAISAVQFCTAEDNARVTLLTPVSSSADIGEGVFTLDLNGQTLTSSDDPDDDFVLRIFGGDVTLQDSAGGGGIVGTNEAENSDAVFVYDGKLTITSGTITGYTRGIKVSGGEVVLAGGIVKEERGSGPAAGIEMNGGSITVSAGSISGNVALQIDDGTVSITGGTITGRKFGICADRSYSGTVTITGGTIVKTGDSGYRGAVTCYGGEILITGGSISGETTDLISDPPNGKITLGLAEDGTGPVFPGGISLYYDEELNAYLDDGVVYWQNNKPIPVKAGQTELPGGDVTVGELNCDHQENTNTERTDNGNGTHSILCGVCGFATETAAHTFDTEGKCVCSAQAAAKIGTTFYGTLAEAAEKAAENDTIYILTDVETDEDIAFAAFVTLDVAEGKIITCTGDVTIGGSEGIIFENELYYYGSDVTNSGVNVPGGGKPFYFKAGEGYIIGATADTNGPGTMKLVNATVNSPEDYGIIQSNLTLSFSGTNTITATNEDENFVIYSYVTGDTAKGYVTLSGEEGAVLNISAGDATSSSFGIYAETVTITGGTVNIVSGNVPNGATAGISANSVVVEEGATLNMTIGKALSAIGTYGSISGGGTVNGLIAVPADNAFGIAFAASGKTVLTADFTASLEGMLLPFSVPADTSLTVNEGVTLDLSGLTLNDIDFSGEIINHGTILLPEGFVMDNAPEDGTITVGDKSYTWDEENDKWICNNENSHIFGTADHCTMCSAPAAAKIGTTFYGTLAEAAEKAAENDTIYILTDVETDEDIAFAAFVTLDVAEGKTITCTGDVTIGGAAAVILENRLYLDQGDMNGQSISLGPEHTKPMYWKAGNGYAVYDGNGTLLMNNVAAEMTTGNSEYESTIGFYRDMVIEFQGTNSLTWSETEYGQQLIRSRNHKLTLKGGENARLNIGTNTQYGVNVHELEIVSGTVTVTSGDDFMSIPVAVDGGITIGKDAVLNATARDAAKYSVGVVGYGDITVYGELNTAFGSVETNGMNVDIMTQGGDIVVSGGKFNSLALSLTPDGKNAVAAYTAYGDAEMTADLTALTAEGATTTFSVPADTSLTVNEGVTLDLSAMQPENIDFSGTIINHGTILLPEGFVMDNAPEDGTITVGNKSYTWDEENDKWICNNENSHTGGTATCNRGKICDLCGTEYGEKDANNHTGTLGTPVPTEDDTQHIATWSCCEATVTEEHSFENHVCTACGAMEIVVSFDAGDFEWKTGDTLYFCRVSGDNEWEEYAFTATVAGDGTVTWTPDKTLYWDDTGKHKLVVVYPGDTPWAWDRFYVGDDQTTTEKLHEFDLMNAMWSGNPTTDPITLNLKHRLAKVTVNYEIAEGVTVSKAEVYTLTQYLLFDIHTLERKNIAWEEGHDLWINSYHNGNQFTAFVSPDAYAAGGNFIKITLDNGTVYEVKMSKAVTFAEGSEYTYKVVITADEAYIICADECTFEYTDNGDGTHTATCSKCGYAVTEEHTLLTYSASGNVITGSCSKCPAVDTATITAENTTYNGTAQETATVAYSAGWKGGELTVFYANNTNAGTATASITVGEATASVEFTIAKAEIDGETLINPEFAEGLIYNGTAQALVTNSGSIDGGYIVFSLNPDGEYTTEIPVATEAGEYVVFYRIEGDENHYWEGSSAFEAVTIAAKDASNATVTLDDTSVQFDGTAKTPGVTSVIVDGKTLNAETDYEVSYSNNIYVGTATVTITFKGNYTGNARSATFTIVRAAAPAIQWPTAGSLTYGQKLSESTLTSEDANGTFAWENGEQIPTVTNSGYVVVYTPKDTVNYDYSGVTLTQTIPVTVSKAPASVETAPAANTLIYTGEAQALVTAGAANNGEMQYSTDNQTWSTTIPAGTNAGDYTVYYKVVGDANHIDTDVQSVVVKIGQLAVAEPTVSGTYTYTGKEQMVTLTGVESYMTVVSGNKAVGAGSYEAVITLDGNHKWADGSDGKVQWSIGKAEFGDVYVSQSGMLTYNGTAQTPNVNTDADSVGNQTATFAYRLTENESYGEMPAFTDAGTYTVYYKASAPNHKDATGSFTVMVDKAKAEITVDTDPITVTYGDTVELPDATANFGTVSCDKTAAELVNVGTYTVTYTVAGTDNYDGDTKTVTVKINPKAITEDDVQLNGSLVYTGSEQTQQITVTAGIDFEVTGNKATNVGSYTLTVTASGNYTGSVTKDWSIKAAGAIVETAPKANNLTYTGEAQALITAGTAKGGKLVYSLSENGTYTETIPTGTNAGEYTVWYYVDGDYNHSDSAKASVKVTIAKATAEITVDTTPITVTYGETVELPDATSNFGTVSCDKTAAELVNAGTYTVTYTVEGTDNYEGDTKTVTVTIEKLAVAEPTVTGTYTYTGEEQTAQLTGVESCMTVASADKATNAGSYEVEITLDGNHQWAEGSDGKVQWSIGKAQAEIAVNTDPITAVYGGTVKLPEATANFGTVTCDTTADKLVNAGTYTVTYTVASTANFDGDSKTVTVTVNPKAITEADVSLNGSLVYTGSELTQAVTVTAGVTYEVTGNKATNVGTYELTVKGTGNYTGEVSLTWSIKAAETAVVTAPRANTLTYTGAAQALVTEGTAKGGKLVYGLTENGTYAETVPTAKNAGSYTVWYYVQGDDNHTDSAKASVKVTIAKAKAEISVNTTPITVTYGEAVMLPTATSSFGTVSRDKTAAELVNAGTYTVTYTVEGTANYEGDTKTLTVIVEKKAVAEPAVTGTYTYTGEEQTAQLTGVESCMTIASGDKATNAGSYEVVITLDGNHKWADGSDGKVQWSIGKAEFGDVYVSQSGMLTYNGTAQTPNVNTDADSVGDQTATFAYRLTENESYGEMPAFTDAGTYTVYYKASAPNHKDATGSFTVTVDKAKAEIAVNTDPITVVYGEAVVLPTATTNFGTVACDKTASDLVNAGTYTVTYSVAGSDNYNGDTKTITVTVNAKVVNQPVIEGIEAVYILSENAITPVPTAVKDGATVIDPSEYTLAYENSTAAGTATVKIVDKDGGNYTVNGSMTFQIVEHEHTWTYTTDSNASKIIATCSNADGHCPNTNGGSVSIQDPDELTYDGSTKDAELVYESWQPEEVTITYNNVDRVNVTGKEIVASIGVVGAGIQSVYTIVAAALPNATLSADSGTYTGQAHTVTVVLDTLVKDTDYTVSIPEDMTNVGTKTITVNGKGNYEGTQTLTYTISKADPSVTTAPAAVVELVYNGRNQNLITTGTATGGTMHYSLDGETWTAAIPAGKNAGEYTVHYKVVGDSNHNDADAETVTVTIAKAAATVETIPTQKHFHYAAATKSLDLSSYLPADRGETTFTLDTKTGTVFENSTAITANTLSYTTKVTEAPANGEIKVKVVMENYEDVTLTVKVELVAVTAQTEERIVKNDLAEVPVGLANDPELDTVAEIKDAQKRVLDLLLGHDPQNNIAHYDVKLQFSPDGGKTWVDATEENFPEAGLTVTLPYPSGTGKDSHRFVVSHMFTTGSKAGTTETPAVTKTATGIRFKVTGLSPVSVAWEAIPFDVKIATVTNGTVYVSPAHTEAGTQVTITATPKSGYKLSTLRVKDAAGNSYTVSTDNNDKYYFTMPAADVTVTATFTAKSNSVADTTNPKTGDSFQLVLWSSMTTTSLLALAVLLKNKKKYYQK